MKKILTIIIAVTVSGLVNSAFSQNFGVGTASPAEMLDVNGFIKTSQGIKFPDGTIKTSSARTKPIIWSGGCNYHGTTGWQIYCNNATEFNTAAGYFTVNGDGTFTVQKSGFFKVKYWGISCCEGYYHINLIHNGTYRQYQYEYVHGTWSDNIMDVTWPMNIGDTFYVQVYGPSTYAFHSWNANGAHSRLQVIYEGPLN